MLFLVLGMHKSGTSLISQILHNSGISMIDSAECELSYDQGNKWERESTKQINHLILNSKGTYSLDISLKKPITSPDISRKIKSVVHQISCNNQNWGFKDPRTCLTYPLWEPTLPSHKIIAIYRSPFEVWERYQKQNIARKERLAITAFKFLRTWCIHNLNILNILKAKNQDSILINYSELMNSQAIFNALEKFIGIKLSDDRNLSLYRDRSSKEDIILDYLGYLNAFYKQPHPREIFSLLENHFTNPKKSIPTT